MKNILFILIGLVFSAAAQASEYSCSYSLLYQAVDGSRRELNTLKFEPQFTLDNPSDDGCEKCYRYLIQNLDHAYFLRAIQNSSIADKTVDRYTIAYLVTGINLKGGLLCDSHP